MMMMMPCSSRVASLLLVLALLCHCIAPCCSQSFVYEGDERLSRVVSPLPFTYVNPNELPQEFYWGNVNNTSYLTRSLNQHIPQYCGSCWAHSSMSALADRIKIAQAGKDPNGVYGDINLSIQFLLNCGGTAQAKLSCHGGSAIRAYDFIYHYGYVPYETCQPYVACSSDSTNGFCPYVDTTCRPINICRSCNHTDDDDDNNCMAISHFPNATVAEYGSYDEHDPVFAIQAEIWMRGPVKASVNAGPLEEYQGGILYDSPITRNATHNHGVSIVGWGYETSTNVSYWICRNSWGQYHGELGFFRVELGKNLLGIESHVAWATPGHFTTRRDNFPCLKDGSNCRPQNEVVSKPYVDPSRTPRWSVQQRLRQLSRSSSYTMDSTSPMTSTQ